MDLDKGKCFHDTYHLNRRLHRNDFVSGTTELKKKDNGFYSNIICPISPAHTTCAPRLDHLSGETSLHLAAN
jgi:hypothetical protein